MYNHGWGRLTVKSFQRAATSGRDVMHTGAAHAPFEAVWVMPKQSVDHFNPPAMRLFENLMFAESLESANVHYPLEHGQAPYSALRCLVATLTIVGRLPGGTIIDFDEAFMIKRHSDHAYYIESLFGVNFGPSRGGPS